VNFTREPIIETIITPKEGCKLVVRNSKGAGQEEFFVDALEVISFGPALFFRSLERPKCFLVPVSDYEILEVRETRMVLKTAPMEKGIKIGGGREGHLKTPKEPSIEKELLDVSSEDEEDSQTSEKEAPALAGTEQQRFDKKRDRRRHRRRRGKGDDKESYSDEIEEKPYTGSSDEGFLPPPTESVSEKLQYSSGFKPESPEGIPVVSPFASLLPPPTTLISETIARYRGNAEYKKAFFQPEEDSLEASEMPLEVFDESKLPEEEKPELPEEQPHQTVIYPTHSEEEFINPYIPDDDYPVLTEEEPEEETTYEDPRKDP
jgi:hypothetical protein